MRKKSVNWRLQLGLFAVLSTIIGSVWAYQNRFFTLEYDTGVEHLRENDIDGATVIFEEMASKGSMEGLYGSAWAAYRKGEYDRAGFYADYLADEASGELRAASIYLQGLLDTVVGMDQRARGRFLAAFNKYEEANNSEGAFRAGLRLASCSLNVGDPETALSVLDDLDPVLSEASGKYWYRKSQTYFRLGHYELAQEFIDKAHEVYLASGLTLGQANALAECGWQLLLTGKYELGLQKTESALSLVQPAGSS
jgi:tetratricopeptide (TPR) repeat protein